MRLNPKVFDTITIGVLPLGNTSIVIVYTSITFRLYEYLNYLKFNIDT